MSGVGQGVPKPRTRKSEREILTRVSCRAEPTWYALRQCCDGPLIASVRESVHLTGRHHARFRVGYPLRNPDAACAPGVQPRRRADAGVGDRHHDRDLRDRLRHRATTARFSARRPVGHRVRAISGRDRGLVQHLSPERRGPRRPIPDTRGDRHRPGLALPPGDSGRRGVDSGGPGHAGTVPRPRRTAGARPPHRTVGSHRPREHGRAALVRDVAVAIR